MGRREGLFRIVVCWMGLIDTKRILVRNSRRRGSRLRLSSLQLRRNQPAEYRQWSYIKLLLNGDLHMHMYKMHSSKYYHICPSPKSINSPSMSHYHYSSRDQSYSCLIHIFWHSPILVSYSKNPSIAHCLSIVTYLTLCTIVIRYYYFVCDLGQETLCCVPAL